MLIGGARVEYGGAGHRVSVNPADETVLADIPYADAAQVDNAVEAAAHAQADWWALDWRARAAALRRTADLIEARAEDILAVEIADTGNTRRRLGNDITVAAESFRYFAGLAGMLLGSTAPASPGGLHFTLRRPYGVVARIVPFNHPFMFAAARIAAPLAAGNAVVIKTPEQSPLSAGLLAEICMETLPPGLVNIIHGEGGVAGDRLVTHPRIRRIGFTGAVPTGLRIQRRAAEFAVKHVSLELGGKNPMLIYPDIDAEQAAEAAVAGMNFSWAGQSCGSTSRLFVHQTRHDAVVEAVVERVRSLRLDDPNLERADMGPVNSSAQLEKSRAYVSIGQEDGARLLTGGGRPAGREKGYWIEPAVFDGVDQSMRIAREEVFGPILSIQSWSDEADLFARANATDFALTASIWTNDLQAAHRAINAVEAGYVWINTASAHYLGTPFGGHKDSGTGSEESWEELLSYTQSTSVQIPRPNAQGRAS